MLIYNPIRRIYSGSIAGVISGGWNLQLFTPELVADPTKVVFMAWLPNTGNGIGAAAGTQVKFEANSWQILHNAGTAQTVNWRAILLN